MGKAERLTLSLEFPEGRESQDTAEITKKLRAGIFGVLGLLDMTHEKELLISMDTFARISRVFADSPFCLERIGDRFSIKERKILKPVAAVVDGKLTLPPVEEREEPDYCAHFRKGEWGEFFEAVSKAVDLAMEINAPKKDGSVPKWRVWFDRGRRVFQYRGEELRLFDNDSKEVDEKTLRAWIQRVNKNKRAKKRREDLRLEEKLAW